MSGEPRGLHPRVGYLLFLLSFAHLAAAAWLTDARLGLAVSGALLAVAAWDAARG